MRLSRALIAPFLIVVVVACGSPGASTGGDDGGDGSAQSDASEPTEAPADGGGGSGDVDAVFEILIPPNSTETVKTAADGVIFAAFESTDSLESLKSFYEGAIADAGLQIFSTTESQGGFAWAIAESEGSTFGGAVSIFPSSSGSGTSVSVTIGSGQ